MNRLYRTTLLVLALLVFPTVAVSGLAADAAETSEPQKISFDDLKFEQKTDQPFTRSMLSKKIEALDGKRVTIRGWMFPPFQLKGLKSFVLVYDNKQMSFGPGFAVNEAIIVDMKPGEVADFSTRPITVDGIFSIRELKVEGKLVAVYHLEATSAK